jgi:hypothetical protein
LKPQDHGQAKEYPCNDMHKVCNYWFFISKYHAYLTQYIDKDPLEPSEVAGDFSE